MKRSSLLISTKDLKTIEYYRNEINNAVSILAKQKKVIDIELNKSEKVEIIAIAFPEILRYNTFSDLIETSTNRILYVNGGKTGSDFSIGIFQMKPSFVEDLEKYVADSEKLKTFENIIIKNKTEKTTRAERISRLEDFRWQLRYLKVFRTIMIEKYSHIKFENKKVQLRFYATAYNYGFTKPLKEILAFEDKKLFPYGNQNKNAARFADFALDFCTNYSSQFNQ